MKAIYQKPVTDITEIRAQQVILAGSIPLTGGEDDDFDAGNADSRGRGFFDDVED